VTIEKGTAEQPARPRPRPRLGLSALIGSGDRIGAFILPIAVGGVALNIAFPAAFSVAGPPRWLQVVSAFVLAVGVVVWAWSVALIVTKVRAGELVTTGPYSLVRHSRRFAPAEEADLARRFGPEWDSYRRCVKIPWL
jgi:protein-S-isoprenylcysteine O-methyltransferase Ste14